MNNFWGPLRKIQSLWKNGYFLDVVAGLALVDHSANNSYLHVLSKACSFKILTLN